MNKSDVFILSISNIFRNKTKFILTLISIVIGITSVMIISLISDIGKNMINNEISSMGIDGISITSEDKSLLTDELMQTIKKRFNVDYVMPVLTSFSSVTNKNMDKSAILCGVDDSLYNTLKVTSVYGDSFTRSDVKYNKNVAVIDENLAKEIFKRTNVVGKSINLAINSSTETFEIVGVIKPQKAMLDSLMGENSPSLIYVPITTASELLNKKDISQIAIRSSENLDKLKISMENYFNKSDEYKTAFNVQNISGYTENISNIANYVSVILMFIASISMVVAGISVLNMMLSSTIERRKEIGIYMSLGATSKKISSIFLMESILICVFSGIVGVLLGILVVFLVTFNLDIDFFVNVWYIINITIISFVCGVTSGIIPAIKASKLNPIDVLRE